MKKSKIVVGVGIFIIITSLLCISPSKGIYEKQIQFNDSNEILNQLENNKLTVIDENRNFVISNQFSECLSLRKRIAGSAITYESIKNIEKQELTEEEELAIKNEYIDNAKTLVNYKVPHNMDVIRVKADTKYDLGDTENKMAIDMVMVDEGEGMVIDYITCWHLDNNGKINKESYDDKG